LRGSSFTHDRFNVSTFFCASKHVHGMDVSHAVKVEVACVHVVRVRRVCVLVSGLLRI
jgi:hypothetical protein